MNAAEQEVLPHWKSTVAVVYYAGDLEEAWNRVCVAL